MAVLDFNGKCSVDFLLACWIAATDGMYWDRLYIAWLFWSITSGVTYVFRMLVQKLHWKQLLNWWTLLTSRSLCCVLSLITWSIPLHWKLFTRCVFDVLCRNIVFRPHRSTSQMRPIAADGVAWSVSLSVGLNCKPCNNGWSGPIKMLFGLSTRMGIGNHVLDVKRTTLRVKRGRPRTCPVVDILRMTLEGAALVQSHQYGADADWGVSTRWGTHWCHLVNTTEPSVCGGDAALCQITLTTC